MRAVPKQLPEVWRAAGMLISEQSAEIRNNPCKSALPPSFHRLPRRFASIRGDSQDSR